MKTAYIDTNVVVSFVKPNDPYYLSARRILTERIVQNISSTLFLIELKSVISREFTAFFGNLSLEFREMTGRLDEIEKIELFYQHILQSIIIDIMDDVSVEIHDSSYYSGQIPASYAKILRVSGKTRLKTLDNLHIAHLILLKENLGVPIDYLITGDQGILARKSDVNRIASVTTISPTELLSIEARSG
ncbi:MAG TPA: hypothetical protein VJ044_05180 [Candidatus Hodarchaeales archaeon]|nr:hypothetical protein [Candidatus Hodarchaeales archaeon]